MPSSISTPGTWRRGVVIAKEAGALVNDFFSGDWASQGNPILAVTPGIAAAMAGATGIRLN